MAKQVQSPRKKQQDPELLIFEDSYQFGGDDVELVLNELERLEASLDVNPNDTEEVCEVGSGDGNRQGTGGNKHMPLVKKEVTTEKKVWKTLKSVPIVNTGYGLIRSVVYASKGDSEEAIRCIPRAVGGVAELGAYAGTAAVFGLTTASIIASPLVVTVGATAAVVAAGSIVGQLVGGGGELIIDACTNDDYSKGDAAVQEQRVYHRIVKDTAILGAVYSVGRAGVYLQQGNSAEAKKSIKNAGFNTLSSALGVAAGVGVAKAASRTVAATTTNVVSSRWYSLSSISSIGRSGLQKVGILSAPKLIAPVQPPLLKQVLVKLLMSTATQNLASSGTHHLTERMQICANRILCSEDFQNLAISPTCFVKCIKTIKDETNPIRVKLKLEYILKCLLSCCLNVREAVQDIVVDEQLMAEIIKTGEIALVQAILVLAAPNSFDWSQRQVEIVRNISDSGMLLAIRYCLQLVSKYADTSKSKEARRLELEFALRKYEYIPSDIIAYRPHQRTDLPVGMRILCLDGGGIMGLVELHMLDYIEKIVQTMCTEPKSIENYFDYITGTSTGGLIALVLALGHPIQEAMALYFNLKNQVFSGQKPYDAELFEKILKEFFGPDKKMKDIVGPRVIITATYGTVDHLKLKMFTNFDDTNDEEIWKVARRTCAAPGYFDPMEEEFQEIKCYYDGGLVANNPTRAVLRLIRDEVINGVIVSVGTGKFVDSGCTLPKIRHGVMDRIRMALTGDLEKLIQLFVNQVTKTDGEVVEDAIYSSSLSHAWYFRLTPTLPEKILLDETDSKKLFNMIFHTMAYANENRETFREIGKLLCERKP